MNTASTLETPTGDPAQTDTLLADVEKNWNEFGKRDPLWAILTADSKRDGKWDLAEFFATGEREIGGVVKNFDSLNHSFGRGKALDFGCGVGRLTQALCRHFEECHGIDIAESMVAQAREYNRFGDRCQYHVNTKPDLSLFANDTFDFVYTNIVLQHNPPAMSRRFIQEFLRILKPGGLLEFQLPSEPIQSTSGEGQAMKPEAFKAQLSVEVDETAWLAGAAKKILVTVKNLSPVVWPGKAVSGKMAVRLGNHWRDTKDRIIINDDARADLPHDLKPGEEVTLALSVSIPGVTGQYRLELDMVQEAVAWFADKQSQTLLLNVNVKPNPQTKAPAQADSMKELDGFFESKQATKPAPEPASAGSPVLVPRMEMNGIPKAEMLAFLAANGAKILRVTDDTGASGWLGFRYQVTKDETRVISEVSDATPAKEVATGPTDPALLAAATQSFLSQHAEASLPAFLVAAYQTFLGRGLDEAGYNEKLILLYGGMTRAELIKCFVESDEFKKLPADTLSRLAKIPAKPAPAPLPPRATLEQYQDIWIKGKLHKKGVRECEERFGLIRSFCEQFKRPFTILDIGSNLGYFSLRLTETFDCTSMAVEGIYGDWIEEVFQANENPRVILVRKVMKLADLRALAEVEHFDVVLGLSVIHHLDGSFDESLEVLRSLGDNLILELPFEANACGQQLVQQAVQSKLPDDAVFMGYGKSHLAEGCRQIVRLSRPKTRLVKSYLGTPRTDLALTIHSDLAHKEVEFHNKPERRPWLRGINLQTYLWFNGAYPPKPRIAQMVRDSVPGGQAHRDIQPWNFILQGGAVQLIDCDDPNHTFAYDDKQYLDRLTLLLRAESLGATAAKQLGQMNSKAEVKLPVRWRGPVFNPSGYASEAINYILPLADRIDLGICHLNNLYSEKFVAGLGQEDRKQLFALRDKYPSMKGGITIDHNPANGFGYVPDAVYRIGRTMFETDRIAPDWVEACNQMDEIWVPSQFNVETFAASGVERNKLVVMPEAVDEHEFNPERHEPLPLPNLAKFNFLAIFEWSSRKAWDVLLASYLREFSAADDVCLYLRTYQFSKPDGDPSAALWELIRKHAATLHLGDKAWPRIHIIAEQVPQADLPRLYKAADCLVAPSRGEGWGRPHHEAMMMGLPVIATNWSGNTEFMNEENSFLIGYELVDTGALEPELRHYQGHRWANPSETDLRAAMRRVQQNPEEAQKKGACARKQMLEKFSRKPVTDRLVARLAEIERNLNTPNCPPTSSRCVELDSAPAADAPVPINWEGSYLDLGSLSHVNRELTAALATTGQLAVTRVGNGVLGKEAGGMPELRNLARSVAAKPNRDAQITVRHAWPPDWKRPATGAWVLMQPWEFGVLPADWVPQLKAVDLILANSEYVRRVYVESGINPSKVKVVPNGIDPTKFSPTAPAMALNTRKKFKFLFVGGTIGRKGPDKLLESYLQSFSCDDDVCLVIKDFGGKSVYKDQTFADQIRLAQMRPRAAEILYLDNDLAAEELPGLYTACDCLVHPYRGEGFGLPVLEAMACGLPVVVTGGGATDDFATDEFAYRIPALRQSIGETVGGLKLVRNGWWLEPDLETLSARLRWVFENRAQARERGAAASLHVRENWTWERAARIAGRHLSELAATKRAKAADIVARRAAQDRSMQATLRIGALHQAADLLAQKKFSEAWAATLAAINIRPFHPDAFLLLAKIALAAGDGVDAKLCAEYARNIAPKLSEAKKILSQRLKGGSRPDWLVLPEVLARGSSPIAGPNGTRNTQYASRLSVCLIVKNEEKFLGQCLKSVRDVASQIVVVDTGSTDRTVEIANEHGAEVHSFVWCDDFSAARNAALAKATGDWVLMLDADEELSADAHEKLAAAMKNPEVMAWRLPIVDVGLEAEGCSYVPRLFRNAPGLFYIGRVHEQVFSSIEVRRAEWGLDNRLGDATLIHHGYTAEVTRDRNKAERNLRLLEQAIEELPDEPHLLMNLGLELSRAGRVAEALVRYIEAYNVLSAKPASEIVPEFREALLTQLTTRLIAAREFEAVKKVLTSSLSRMGSGLSASLNFSLGLAHLELKQFSEAAGQMRQCLAKRNQRSLAPINKDILTAAPHHCLALCLAKSGDAAGADKAFQAGLAETGHADVLRLDYAQFLFGQGKAVEALQLLHEIVSNDVANVMAWRFGGQIAFSQPGFLEFARDWTGEALRAHANDLVIMAQRAEALMLSDDAAASAGLWERVASRNPNNVVLAALIACENIGGTITHVPQQGAEEVAASRAFIGLYQRLIAAGAQNTVIGLNARMGQLGRVLPTAARILETAVAEANQPELVSA